MKITYKLLAVFMVMIAIFACSEMNDLHDPYLKDGEQIYIGKALDVLPYPGKNRVKLTWNINADPKITTARIQWRDTEDRVVEFPITPVNGVVEHLIENVPEGGFNFDIYMLGDNGERSVKVQVPGVIYGSKYESRLFNRTISTIAKITPGNHADITWGPLTTGMRGTTLKYTNKLGVEKVIYIPNTGTIVTRISDYTSESQFSYSTSFRPVQNVTYLNKPFIVEAIDTLNAGFVNGKFPKY